jgi:3-oxoacyl-[acyl-carrier protein] reductase
MKKDKIVLIAGGDGGVGFSCVKLFLNSGYQIIIIDKKCRNKNFYKKNDIYFFKSSLNSEKKIKDILLKIKKKIGFVSVLINCVGKFSKKKITEINQKEINESLNINVIYPILLIKNFIKNSTKQKKITKIINIGSIAGQNGGEFAGEIYSISKAAIINLTKSIAKKYGKKNIICNCINPGPLDTQMTNNWSQKIKQSLIKKYRLNTNSLGSAQDVAHACLFLASDNSNYIQGSELNINGGLVI